MGRCSNTELRKDGFGAQPCFQCIVAEQLIDGQPSNMHRFVFCFVVYTFDLILLYCIIYIYLYFLSIYCAFRCVKR